VDNADFYGAKGKQSPEKEQKEKRKGKATKDRAFHSYEY
jgi:hypothetical protein